MSARALLAFALLVASCGEDLIAYPLEAQRYDEARDCVDEGGVIDVIEGEPEGSCTGVICMRSGETGDLYVSAICEAPPGYDRIDAADPVCQRALTAREEERLCPSS